VGNNIVPVLNPPEVPDVVEASDSVGEEEEDNGEDIPRLRRQVKSNRRSRRVAGKDPQYAGL